MMFDSTVSITGQRPGRQIALAIPACVVDDGIADPLSTNAVANDADAQCFFVWRGDWSEVEPPQIGDLVTTADDAVYAVRKVTRLGDVFALSTRRR